jgi:hypothetical protein
MSNPKNVNIFNKFKDLQDIIKLEAAKYESCKINIK